LLIVKLKRFCNAPKSARCESICAIAVSILLIASSALVATFIVLIFDAPAAKPDGVISCFVTLNAPSSPVISTCVLSGAANFKAPAST
jgi:hypothetical protein